jgi:hypothetical protein
LIDDVAEERKNRNVSAHLFVPACLTRDSSDKSKESPRGMAFFYNFSLAFMKAKEPSHP